jgi:hypothetical protein
MDFTTDKLRSLVRKWQSLIEAHVDVKTTDGYMLRVFCIAFTKKRQNQVKRTCYAQTGQVRQIRKKMVEIITREATSVDLKDLVQKFIPEAIGKDIEKNCQGGGRGLPEAGHGDSVLQVTCLWWMCWGGTGSEASGGARGSSDEAGTGLGSCAGAGSALALCQPAATSSVWQSGRHAATQLHSQQRRPRRTADATAGTCQQLERPPACKSTHPTCPAQCVTADHLHMHMHPPHPPCTS